MTDPAVDLRWESFLSRLRRTLSPHSVWPVLRSARGPQLYLPEREVLLPRDTEHRKLLRLEVVNLGSDRARLQAEVFDSAGTKIGKNLPDSPYLAAGRKVNCAFRPTQAQWRALLNGGRLVVGPSSLPEDYRTFRFVSDPLEEPKDPLVWPFPVPHCRQIDTAHLRGISESLWLEFAALHDTMERVFARVSYQHYLTLAPLQVLLPYNIIRVRIVDERTSSAEWESTIVPDFLRREWTIGPNRAPVDISGELSVSPPGRVIVEIDRLELSKNGSQTIPLTLDPGWLAELPLEGETLELRIERSNEDGVRDSPVAIRKISLVPQTLEAPILRGRDLLPPIIEASFRAGWLLELPAVNVGLKPAEVFLRFADGGATVSTKLQPRSAKLQPQSISLTIPSDIAARAPEGGFLAWIESAQPVVWDPRLLGYQFRVVFKDELLSEKGNLRWEVEQITGKTSSGSRAGRRFRPAVSWLRRHGLLPISVRVRLVFEHREKRRRNVTLWRMDIYQNDHPLKETAYRHKTFRPGEKRSIATEILRLWRWSRVALRAKVGLKSDGLTDRREALIVLRWKSGGQTAEYSDWK